MDGVNDEVAQPFAAMELDQIEQDNLTDQQLAVDHQNANDEDEDDTNQTRRSRGRPSKNEEALKKRVKKLEMEKVAIKGKLHEAKKQLKSQTEEFKSQIKESDKEKEDMRAEIDNIKEEYVEQQLTADSLHSELKTVKEQLKEIEIERDELIEQMASSSLNTTDSSIRAVAKGIVLFDSTTKPILSWIDQSNSAIMWSGEKTTLRNLVKVDLDSFKCMDVALILTGADEIKEGANGLDVFGMATAAATQISKVCKVILVTLPPSRIRGATGNLALFNFKLSNKYEPPNENIQVIKIDYENSKKDALINESDELTELCIKLTAAKINEVEAPKERKSDDRQIEQVEYKTATFMPIQQKDIGRIIGKAGNNISRLTKEFRVDITIGKWLEPKAGNKETFDEKTHAIIISGTSTQTKACQEHITEWLKTDFSKKQN